jgi:phosphatidylserine/phosphatidylglycerophosphate/cardiolipin synthase-like enzyme
MSLFKGRDDVYARRWENKKKGTSGYSPSCVNEWKAETVLFQGALDLLQNAGVSLICRPNIHQKFAVIDRGIVWYGSINLLSFSGAEESMMRLESPNIANELLKILEQTPKC